MKKYLIVLLFLSSILVNSCKDNAAGSGGIFGPGGGGNVTFTMQGQGDVNSYFFYFKPSVDVKLTKIIARIPSQQQPFYDSIPNPQPDRVFSKDTLYPWYDYQGVQAGQAWTFAFTGNITSNNQAFTTTTNFTVP